MRAQNSANFVCARGFWENKSWHYWDILSLIERGKGWIEKICILWLKLPFNFLRTCLRSWKHFGALLLFSCLHMPHTHRDFQVSCTWCKVSCSLLRKFYQLYQFLDSVAKVRQRNSDAANPGLSRGGPRQKPRGGWGARAIPGISASPVRPPWPAVSASCSRHAQLCQNLQKGQQSIQIKVCLPNSLIVSFFGEC